MLVTKNLKLRKPSKKLSAKFARLFRIVDRVGAQAYLLYFPKNYEIHDTFYVSLLEPYHHRESGPEAETFMQAPELIDDEEQWEIEEVTDDLTRKGEVWCKVKWIGWSREYDQWVPDHEMDRARDVIKQYQEQSAGGEPAEPRASRRRGRKSAKSAREPSVPAAERKSSGVGMERRSSGQRDGSEDPWEPARKRRKTGNNKQSMSTKEASYPYATRSRGHKQA